MAQADNTPANASDPRTLQELVQQLSRFGGLPALIGIGQEVESATFAELASRAGTIAGELRANGIGIGEPVAIVAHNSLDWAAACLGTLAAGAAVAPFDVQQDPADRARLISALGCRFMFGAAPGGDGSASVIQGCGSLVLHSLASAPAGTDTAPASSTPPVVRPEDLALIVHTSGTTGTPKAVPLTHANVVSNILGLAASGVANTSERALMPLPLHHIYPLVVGLITPLSQGASVVLPSGISGPELARALRLGGATVLIGVPRLYESMLAAILAQAKARGLLAAAIFQRLLNLSIALARMGQRSFGRLAFKSLRRKLSPTLYRMVSGGAALSETSELTLIALGYDVLKGYGMSETSPIMAFTPPGRSRVSSAGLAVPGTELRIVRPDFAGAGEIEARGPGVFSGYRNDPAATQAAFTADGWYHTGDRGRMDAEGNLYVLGRASETLVLPGGEKLDPETVEARYAGNAAIAEMAVLAWEGKLAGLAVPSPAAQAKGDPEAEVRAALAGAAATMPSYMQLSGFAVTIEPLPRTQAGKLRRHLLPPLYEEAKRHSESLPAIQTGLAANPELAANPTAGSVWAWLEARFPDKRLSLDMNPKLDLGIDSLGWVTVTMELEQELGIALDETALAQVVTLRDLVLAATKAAPLAPSQTQQAQAVPPAKPGIFTRAAWYALHALNRIVMRTVFSLRVEGAGNLPAHGPYLICPNHLSYLDAPVIAAGLSWPLLRQVYWAGAADILFTSGWRRGFSRTVRILAVDPGMRTAFAQSATVLETGHILVWFPEAWRSADGTLQPFLPGIGTVLLKNPLPVVPAYITGTYEAWPRQRRFPRPRAVTVRFGTPIPADRWANLAGEGEAGERIARSIKEAVAALASRP